MDTKTHQITRSCVGGFETGKLGGLFRGALRLRSHKLFRRRGGLKPSRLRFSRTADRRTKCGTCSAGTVAPTWYVPTRSKSTDGCGAPFWMQPITIIRVVESLNRVIISYMHML